MELKIAVISDLHCRHSKSDKENNTFLFSDNMRSPIRQHPAQAFITKIKEQNITADIVLCPGDITNKTDPQGLITGWSFLEEIKDALSAKHLIASLGNHDVDSRRLFNNYDSFNMPSRLKENFPFHNDKARDEFYSKKFCFIELDDTLIFNFNSVHSHTNGEDCLTSIVTDDILENIEERLKVLSKKKFQFKIALTHYHPLKHANMGSLYKDSDVIEKGDSLINILESNDFQIFIHGHKHIPRLAYYNSLPILSSGSFSSLMNLMETGNKNMVHLLTLFSSSKNGLIRTFEFTNGLGWSDNYNSKVLPRITGFGNRRNIEDITESITKYFDSRQLDFIKFDELLLQMPELRFLIPSDFEKVRKDLIKKKLILYPEDIAVPDQLTKISQNGI